MQERVNKWLLVSSATLVAMLCFGLAFQFGSFLIALLDTFNRDRSRTAIIPSLHVGFTVGFGVVSGALITRFGVHYVTLCSSLLVAVGYLSSFFATNIEFLYGTIGIVTGIGNSMGYISSVVVIGRVLAGRQMVFSLAIHSCSVGVAGLVYPYLIDILLSKFGLRGTFLILAALQSNACAFTVMCWINKDKLNEMISISSRGLTNKTESLLKLDERKTCVRKVSNSLQRSKEYSGKAGKLKRIFYKRSADSIGPSVISEKKETIPYKSSKLNLATFLMILLTSVVSVGSLNGYRGLILDISKWNGFSLNQGLFSFVVYNISTIVVRPLPGILKQRKCVSLFIFPIVSSLAGCISAIVMYHGTSYASFIASMCLVGVTTGGIVSSMMMIIIKIIPGKQVPIATGSLATFTGISAAVTGPVFGKLRDVTGSYNNVHLALSCMHAVGVVLSTTALLLQRRKNRRKSMATSLHNYDTG